MVSNGPQVMTMQVHSKSAATNSSLVVWLRSEYYSIIEFLQMKEAILKKSTVARNAQHNGRLVEIFCPPMIGAHDC